MPEEAPVTSAVPLAEVVMSVLRFASRWLEPVGRTVTYALFTPAVCSVSTSRSATRLPIAEFHLSLSQYGISRLGSQLFIPFAGRSPRYWGTHIL